MHIGISGPILISSINLKHTGDRSGWPLGMGGVPVNHLINALLELGHRVPVFSLSPEISVGESFDWHEENISIYIGPYRKRPRHYCLDFFRVERRYISNTIIKAQPDVVHAHWSYEWAWGAIDSGFPTLVTCHDSPWHIFKAQTDFYRLYRLVIAIIVMNKAKNLNADSEPTAKSLRLLTAKKLTVIPNFEPDEVFNLYQLKPLENKIYRIAMINNGFTTLKNVGVGIEAFVKLRAQKPYAELHLFGSSHGIAEEAYKWAKQRFCLDNIYFHGSVLFSDLMESLSTMDIFLHTSIHESFCMVLVESMALGLPVIAAKDSGGPEWILKDGGGLLVDVTKVDEIKQALQRLFDSEYHQQLSLKAREVALSRFAKEKVVGQYVNAYKDLLHKKTYKCQ